MQVFCVTVVQPDGSDLPDVRVYSSKLRAESGFKEAIDEVGDFPIEDIRESFKNGYFCTTGETEVMWCERRVL